MDRVADPLKRMGARIETTNGRPPVVVEGTDALKGIEYVLPMASAQVKSAILLRDSTRTARPQSSSRRRPATTPS